MSIPELSQLTDDELFTAVWTRTENIVSSKEDILEGFNSLNEEQRIFYAVYYLEMEVNNGGLCQFFVNSSSACAPYISSALAEIGASEMQHLYDNFISSNNIDVNDLSSFKIDDIDEYEKQTERYDFDSFDDKFYDDANLHQQIIDYARNKIEYIIQ